MGEPRGCAKSTCVHMLPYTMMLQLSKLPQPAAPTLCKLPCTLDCLNPPTPGTNAANQDPAGELQRAAVPELAQGAKSDQEAVGVHGPLTHGSTTWGPGVRRATAVPGRQACAWLAFTWVRVGLIGPRCNGLECSGNQPAAVLTAVCVTRHLEWACHTLQPACGG